VNPGFESGSPGWTKSTFGGRPIDSTKSHSGINSQKMVVSNLYGREVYQALPAVAGTTYFAQGWVESSGAGGGGARIELQWFNQQVTTDIPPASALIRTDVLGTVAGTQAWTQVGGTFTVPANTVQVRFRLFLFADPDNAGAAWFDDAEFYVVPDVTPPTISNVAASGITLQSATITWTTNEPADSQVEYGPSAVYGSSTPVNSAVVTSHSVTLTGLAPNSLYHYRVLSKDPSGNAGSSGDFTFTTLPDQTAPTVSVTAPAAGATVSGTVTISATASDNVGVTGVQFKLDGAPLGAEITTAPYDFSWDTTAVADGAHTLEAVARDAAGNVGTSGAITVKVSNQPDQAAPTVSITAPAAGATVSGTVTISASASDNVGVTGVQFKLDGAPLGAEITAAPYDFSWDTTAVADGAHTLEAVARDAAGNVGKSASVSVTVNNQVLTNAVVNPGFESGSLGWTKSTFGGRSIDSTKRHSGVNSQKMLVSNLYGREVYQTLPAVAGTTYTARGWIDTSGAGGGGARIELQWFNQQVTTDVPPAGALIRTDVLGTVAGTQAWTQVGGSFTTPANTVQVRYRLFLSADPDNAGSAWFDDTELLGAPDVTPPSVSIHFPLSGTTVSNTVTLTASASDDRAVAGVRFYVDGGPIGAEDTSPPYSIALDTTLLALGAHDVTAVARDTSGNQATSSAVTINVVTGASRPNMVVILTDDQRFDLMQYMPLTSGLLSSETVKFQNAFVTTPDCCPSRASILTGLYSHNTGVLQDYNQSGGAISFNPNSTMATWLKDAGYRTGIYGKYLNAYYLLSPAVPPGWSEFHVFVRRNGVNSEDDYYYNYEFNDNGVVSSYGTTPQDYSTNVLAAKAVQFIASTPVSQPLFLYFTPFGPHAPATPDPQDVGAFSNFPDWRPASFNEADVSDKPAWVQALPLLTPTEIANSDAFHRSQLETLQSVDRAVANIVAELQQAGRWNNTLLIFMSDNGLIWDEHRIQDSKFSPYEESVRVPLWVRAPGVVSRQESGLAANIDLAPTIAEWAGVIPPSRVNGLSLIPLLTNPGAPWRSEILLEYLGPTISAYLRYQAVRTRQYLYVEYLSGDRELYDLAIDPLQLNNVVNDPAYAATVTTLRALLAGLKVS
jgi:arylsulfatase A-like enzyme